MTDISISLVGPDQRLALGAANRAQAALAAVQPIVTDLALNASSSLLAISAALTAGTIQAVAGSIAAVGTVSANIAAVGTVSGSIANINTVAAGITAVNAVATDLALGGASLIRQAPTAAANAQAAAVSIPAIQATIGTDLSEATQYIIGNVLGSGAVLDGTKAWGYNSPTAYAGVLSRVDVELNAAGTGYIDIVQGGTVIKSFAVTLSAGANSVTNFNGYIMPAGSLVFYRAVTGGAPMYDGGVSGYPTTVSYASSGVAVGSAVTLSAPVNNYRHIKVWYLASTNPVTARIAALATQVAPVDPISADINTDWTGGPTISLGDSSATSGSISNAISYGVSTADAVKGNGLLTSCTIGVNGAGTGNFEVYRPVAGAANYQLVYRHLLTFTAAGTATFALTDGFRLRPGDLVAYAMLTGSASLYYSSGGNNPYFQPATFTAVGAVGPTAITTLTPAIAFTMTAEKGNLKAQFDVLGSLTGSAVRGPFALNRKRFDGTVTPTDWTLGASFSVNNGLSASSGGGWSMFAGWSLYSVSHQRAAAMRVNVVDPTSVFGIAAQPNPALAAYGAVAMVDGSAGRFRLYEWTGSGTGTLITDVAMPALVAGRDYVVKIVREALTVTATLFDPVLQTTTTVSWTFGQGGNSSAHPFFDGRPGVLYISGSINVRWFEAYGTTPRYVRAIIFGDSNAQGNVNISNDPTWAQQVVAARGANRDIMLSAKGGATTTTALVEMACDLALYRPEYVVLALGTNDTSQAVWRLNIKRMIAWAYAVGAEPILVCSMPKASNAGNQAINVDIRSGYFGNLRSIDFATAISLNNDGITWNPTYDYGDSTHVNAAGQSIYYKQAQIDAPFLLGA